MVQSLAACKVSAIMAMCQTVSLVTLTPPPYGRESPGPMEGGSICMSTHQKSLSHSQVPLTKGLGMRLV